MDDPMAYWTQRDSGFNRFWNRPEYNFGGKPKDKENN
jgi:hypothetical protein